MIQIGGVYTTFCQEEGMLLQKHRDRMGGVSGYFSKVSGSGRAVSLCFFCCGHLFPIFGFHPVFHLRPGGHKTSSACLAFLVKSLRTILGSGELATGKGEVHMCEHHFYRRSPHPSSDRIQTRSVFWPIPPDLYCETYFPRPLGRVEISLLHLLA